jgi:hypothetical protein
MTFVYFSKTVLEYWYVVYSALEVESGVVILKTVKTETYVRTLTPVYHVPPSPILGAHITSSLWCGLLTCWRDSSNEMSLNKSHHCIIK